MKSNIKNLVCLVICLFFICFITLLSRTPTLNRITHLIPLWSYASRGHWRQIFLNIALFIPLGYFLRSLTKGCWAFLLSFFISVAVEAAQFFSYRGMLDVDDLISNGLGAMLGILLFFATQKKAAKVQLWTGRGLLIAGLVGYLMIAIPAVKSDISNQIARQFWFSADTVVIGEELIIDGSCFTYNRRTPDYTLKLGSTLLETTVDGANYSAVAPLPDEKTELLISFNGYQIMPTGIWIKPDGNVDFVSEDVTDPVGVPVNAVLKAYSPEFDTFVYEDGDRLLWFIGWEELDESTEIIYHIHTNEPEKLPENRVQYKFDNRGFRGKESAPNELDSLGHYRVFEREIPTEYNVTAIIVGFNTSDMITWTATLRPTELSQKPTHRKCREGQRTEIGFVRS